METSRRIKLLIIAAHRPNRSPSQRFRFEQYYAFFTANGVDAKLSYIITEKDDVYFYTKGFFFRKLWILSKAYLKRWRDVLTCGKYDVILVQREAIMTRTTLFERLLAKRKPLIFDFDDAIWKMDVSVANQKLKWMKNPSKISKIIKISNAVIAGNSYLKKYADDFNSNVSVIPTTVDTDLFKPLPKSNSKIVIGWSGSKTTIKHFELAVDVLKKIKNVYGEKISFKIIGEPNYSNKELGIISQKWNALTEVEELNSIDIGIMPLPNDEWSKGKCGLKGLTYMALEIPTIMYNIGVNSEIIEHGVNGFLYKTDEELFKYIELLINNAELRKSIGAMGRLTVLEKYSVVANQANYLQIIKSVVKF